MILAHCIALDPTEAQAEHFRQACGVARFAYNWALAEWKRQYEAGEKPSEGKLRKQLNSIKAEQFPWMLEVTKCAPAQAIMNLGTAFSNFFRDLKKTGRKSGFPKFKKKGVNESFGLANDIFRFNDDRVRLPKLGWVRMRETVRFDGKILGATVRQVGHRWHLIVRVELSERQTTRAIPGSMVGIDLGISTLLTLSQPLANGSVKIANRKPQRTHMKRQAMLQRRISRQQRLRKPGALKSNRQARRQQVLRRLHHRITCTRLDAIHKATTAVTSRFQTIVLENLNVSGMSKNHALAGAVLDASFREIRRQIEYKAVMRGGRVVIADRFFPSSKACSACGVVADTMPLNLRQWTCSECGAEHDRDVNAAKNLEKVGRATSEPLATATHGETAALAAPQGAVKPRSVNRELNRGCVYALAN